MTIPTEVIMTMATIGLSEEQARAVADMLTKVEEATAKAHEESKEKARARWRNWKAKQPAANADKRLPTVANVGSTLAGGDARVEDKTSNSVQEPQDSKGVAKARPTRLPENFTLPDEWRDWAIAKGLPPERVPIEFQKLCNWAANAGSKGAKSNWFKAWQNWVLEAIDKLPRNRGPTQANVAPSMARVFGMVREKAAENEQRRGGGDGAGALVLNLPAVRAQ